jgi:hypothetical protein
LLPRRFGDTGPRWPARSERRLAPTRVYRSVGRSMSASMSGGRVCTPRSPGRYCAYPCDRAFDVRYCGALYCQAGPPTHATTSTWYSCATRRISHLEAYSALMAAGIRRSTRSRDEFQELFVDLHEAWADGAHPARDRGRRNRVRHFLAVSTCALGVAASSSTPRSGRSCGQGEMG